MHAPCGGLPRRGTVRHTQRALCGSASCSVALLCLAYRLYRYRCGDLPDVSHSCAATLEHTGADCHTERRAHHPCVPLCAVPCCAGVGRHRAGAAAGAPPTPAGATQLALQAVRRDGARVLFRGAAMRVLWIAPQGCVYCTSIHSPLPPLPPLPTLCAAAVRRALPHAPCTYPQILGTPPALPAFVGNLGTYSSTVCIRYLIHTPHTIHTYPPAAL